MSSYCPVTKYLPSSGRSSRYAWRIRFIPLNQYASSALRCAIRAIVANAGGYLASPGWLLFEHGYNQAEAVQALLRDAGFAEVQSRRDLAGIPRVTFGRRAPPAE